MREIVFDTETTGRDPASGDRIVEVGCVELHNLTPTGRTFHRYVNPGRDIPEEVVRVHGLTARFLANCRPFSDPSIVDELLEFLGDSPIVAHNAEFDRAFLNTELARCGRDPAPVERFIDTLGIARAKFRGAANSLDALSRRFMLDRDGFDLESRRGPGGHGALIDAKILSRVYLELRGGREQSLAFDAPPTEQIRETGAIIFAPHKPRPAPLPPRLTASEAEAHSAFVAELGPDAIWSRYAA
jgi:DNA polymerase-3 subunit epsilon